MQRTPIPSQTMLWCFCTVCLPFSDLLNDLSYECSATMFSYINLRGKYPPGLFASMCTGTKQGLDCPRLAPSQSTNDDANSSQINCKLSPVQIMATAFMWVLLLVFWRCHKVLVYFQYSFFKYCLYNWVLHHLPQLHWLIMNKTCIERLPHIYLHQKNRLLLNIHV